MASRLKYKTICELDRNLMVGSSREKYLCEFFKNEEVSSLEINGCYITAVINNKIYNFEIIKNCTLIKQLRPEDTFCIAFAWKSTFSEQYFLKELSKSKNKSEFAKMLIEYNETIENSEEESIRLQKVSEITNFVTYCTLKVVQYQSIKDKSNFLHLLMMTCIDNRLSDIIIPILINKGIDLSAVDSLGNTALLWGIANANFESVMSLLKHTRLDENDEHIKKINQSGMYKNSPIDLLTAKAYRDKDGSGRPIQPTASSIYIAHKLVHDFEVRVGITKYWEYCPLAMTVLKADLELFTLYLGVFEEEIELYKQKPKILKELSKQIYDALRINYNQTKDFLINLVGKKLFYLSEIEEFEKNRIIIKDRLDQAKILFPENEIYEVKV